MKNFNEIFKGLEDLRHRSPIYDSFSDYNTNSKSYYDYLARFHYLMKILVERVAEYDKELAKRFEEWDKLIEKFPENVEKLLIEWLDDGILADILREAINEEVMEARRNAKNDVFNSLKDRLDNSDLKLDLSHDYVNVVEKGVKNDGSNIPIGLIDSITKQSLGKTIFFPAGVYNLSEPIRSFNNPEKRVNFIFDRNAIIKTNENLDCLFHVGGIDEIADNDRTEFELYGGSFHADNCRVGILINRKRMNVTLQSNYIKNAMFANIMVEDYGSSTSPHSSTDLNIKDAFIEGRGSQYLNNYGIYIPNRAHDTKIMNLRIQGCRVSIFSDSGGNYLDNAHLFSRGDHNAFNETIGILFGENSTGGTITNTYFDTTAIAIQTLKEYDVSVNVVNSEYYSYLTDFKMCFMDIASIQRETRIYVLNTKILMRIPNSYILKLNQASLNTYGYDFKQKIVFQNILSVNQSVLASDDIYLTMQTRKDYYHLASMDSTGLFLKDVQYPIGLMLRSSVNQTYQIELNGDQVIEVCVRIPGNRVEFGIRKIYEKVIHRKESNNIEFQIAAYKARDGYVMTIRFYEDINNPLISVINTNMSGKMMVTPRGSNQYDLSFYNGVQTSSRYELYRGRQ